MNRFNLLILLAFCGFLLPAQLVAQSQAEIEQAMERFSESLGIPKGSRFYKRYRLGLARSYRNLREQQRSSDPLKSEKSEEAYKYDSIPKEKSDTYITRIYQDRPVLKHYRGKFGVPFPSEEEIVSTFRYDVEKIKRIIEDSYRGADEYVKQLEVGLYPSCKESRTTKTKVSAEATKEFPDPDIVIVDMLFINKNDIPFNYEEMWGKRVVVRPLEQGAKDMAIPYLRELGMTCLPFRVRVTPKYQFVHQGFDALKNFEDKPTGKGKLDEQFKFKKKLIKEREKAI